MGTAEGVKETEGEDDEEDTAEGEAIEEAAENEMCSWYVCR